MYCWKCGHSVPSDAKFCTSCGEFVGGETDSIHVRQSHASGCPWNGGTDRSLSVVQNISTGSMTKRQRNVFVSVITVVVVIIILFAVHGYRSMVLGRVMNTCENQVDAETWDLLVDSEYPVYRLADRGHTLIVDGASPSSDILSCIVEESGMPESVVNRIDATRALDGTLNDSWDNITVSWNYHPDTGVNMVFEVK